MQNLFENYIQSISSKFSHEETSEMGYRTDFEMLIKGIFESINVKRIDHDAKAQQGNKPDFVVLNYDIPILYIEAKDICVSLDKVEASEQMARYYGYANLVLTDYVEFRFYRNGLPYEEPIKIANYNIRDRTITPIPENYDHVAKTLIDFTQSHKEPIRSGKHLAKIMGGKAQRIRDNVRQYLSTESEKNTELMRVYETIKKLLVRDLTLESFADMYAQTLVYGLFVARYHDETPDNFTRQEARDLVPASNPLLRHFFDHIVGPDFDKRLEYIVNELCEVFSHASVPELMKQYFKDDLWGQSHEGPDPVIHFYEDFLKEYDANLRKKLGAFYTPLPVVRFIIRAVDYILEKEFSLSQGLADTSKTGETHRVQILDPAVGTGTFLTEVIRNIYLRFTNQKGRWPTYVHHDLLPRLHGFELMMAPYTIAHLKMSMILKETGFKYFNNTRLGIYLTNSLEMESPQRELFAFDFAASIAEESKEASVIKNKTPIMVVIGNPPYSGVSSNETQYANSLVEKYKIEPGGMQKLQERKHWLNDDYVKFIAFAENMVAKNKEGIIGFITNHSYLDNPTFRGMRWHLMDTFDSLYIIDLHGNAKKKEVSPDGSKDENVFDIQQGVAIMVAIKTGKKNKGNLAKVYRTDLWGKRKSKFDQLNNLSFENAKWTSLKPRLPNLFFAQSGSAKLEEEYQRGFKTNECFNINSVGMVTAKDKINISFNKNEIKERFLFIIENTEQEIRNKFGLNQKDSRDWTVLTAKKDATANFSDDRIIKCSYRPFDERFTFYTGNSRGVYSSPQKKVMQHFLKGPNLGLLIKRQGKQNFSYIFVVNNIAESCIFESAYANNTVCPLYLYLEDDSRVPNLKNEIVKEIEKIIGKVSPEDIFDYIYAILHSPNYREKYKEFLKIDFPRVPYPQNKEDFRKFVKIGSELRSLHLLESPKVNKFITTYPIDGSNTVESVIYKDGKVFINKDQYFGNVPEVAWTFYIGGYQPAQKWLKDRKGRTLTNEDIEHYQKIIVALSETGKIMTEIDKLSNDL